MGAVLCDAFWGCRGEAPAQKKPVFLKRSVKTHRLLLTKVTKLCIMDSIEGRCSYGSVSMPQGKGSQLHNRREYEKIGKPIPDNIDVSKSSENITLVDKDIKQAYQEIFGEALEKYNAKQKRADRKMRTTATTSEVEERRKAVL